MVSILSLTNLTDPSAKATTALNFFGIKDEIDFIVEDNQFKHNKFIPGVKIPIKNKSFIKDKKNVLLVLAWNFFISIVKKCKKHFKNKIVYIKAFPKIKKMQDRRFAPPTFWKTIIHVVGRQCKRTLSRQYRW